MARYLATIEGTTEAFRGFIQNPENRQTANQPLFNSLGFDIEHYWFGVVETNIYLVFTTADDDADTQALVMAVCASGIVHSMKVSRIMTAEEGVVAMKKAAAIVYSAPGNS